MIGSSYLVVPGARRLRLWCIMNRPTTRAVTTISARARFSGTDRPLHCRATFLQHSDPSTASTRTKSAIAAPRPGLPGDGLLPIRGFRVAVRIKVAFPPALGAYLLDLRADGLQVIRTVPAYGMAEGTAADRQVAGRSAARGARVARFPAYQKVNPSRYASIDHSGSSGRCFYCGFQRVRARLAAHSSVNLSGAALAIETVP